MTITEIIKLIKNKLPPTIDDYDEWWNDEDNDDCELTFTFNHCNYSIEISNYKDFLTPEESESKRRINIMNTDALHIKQINLWND